MRSYLSISTLCMCLALSSIAPLSAQPSGMEVTSGTATSATPSENTLQITASDRAIIQWDRFSIGVGELTQFVLPNSASIVLNRVTGGEMSQLLGVLQSNGQIYLINPQGVIVGPDATIDTAGFVGSTFDVLDRDFIEKMDLLFQGDSTASIVNLGTISTATGDVILIARNVSNQGQISAPQGTAALGAGAQILLKPTDSQRIYIQPSGLTGDGLGVENSGNISALFANLQADGQLYAQAIGHSGYIEALGVAEQNGRVYLVADGGRIDVTGGLKASAAEMIGALPANDPETVYGEIRVLGGEIYVTGVETIDVSNATGGGFVSLGYEINPGDTRAKGLVFGTSSTIKADATAQGNGGKVMLWGTDANFFGGPVFARGGSEGGDGGFVEASTKGSLRLLGFADTRAPKGKTGTFFIDPTDITISGADLNIGTSYSSGTNTLTYTILNPNAATTINATTLATNLGLSNVVISTASAGANSGNITISNPISWAAANLLTLSANQDILVNANVAATSGGSITMTAVRDISIWQPLGATTVTVSSDTGALSFTAYRNFNLGENLQTAAFTTANTTISTTSGAITITTPGFYDQTNAGVLVTGGTAASSLITSTSGNILINSSGTFTIQGNAGAANSAQITNTSGNIIINTAVPTANSPLTGSFTMTATNTAGGLAKISTSGSGGIYVNVGSGNAQISGATAAVASGASITTTGSGILSFVGNGNLTVAANSDTANCGLIGNTGNTTVQVNGNTTLTGGSGASAVIQTANALSVSVMSNLSLTGGTNATSTSNASIQTTAGSLSLFVGGYTKLQSGNGAGTNHAQIVAQTGMNANFLGNVTLQSIEAVAAGTADAYMQLVASGTFNMNVGGTLTLTGSPSTGATSCIGRALIRNEAGTTLNLNCTGDVSLTCGNSGNTNAQIGAIGNNGGPINLTCNNLILQAGLPLVGGTPGALIGHGFQGSAAQSVQTAAITVTANNSIFLLGNSAGGNSAFAQIGHYSSAATGGGMTNTLSGNIRVTAVNEIRMGGLISNAGANATIGHAIAGVGPGQTGAGGVTPTTANFSPAFTVAVFCQDVTMTGAGGGAGGFAQILNGSTQTTNAITIVCDNQNPTYPDYGTGLFSFGQNCFVNAGAGANGQVRIYTSVRIFNTVVASGTIAPTPGGTGGTVNCPYTYLPINNSNGGATTLPGFPVTVPGSSTTANEVWGVYYDPTQGLGGGGAYPPDGSVSTNFVFYYKRVGGVLINGANTTAGVTLGATTTFPASTPEVYINPADIVTQLSSTNVSINAELLSNTSPVGKVLSYNPIVRTAASLNGNSIVLNTTSITWNPANNHSLTLGAGNDILILGTLNNSSASTGGGITLNAGRDVRIGAGAPQGTAGIVQTTGAANPISIIAGRDCSLIASCSSLATNVTADVSALTNGAVTCNIGRDLNILAANSLARINALGSGGLNITVGRNCTQIGGSGVSAVAEILTQAGGSLSVGGLHTISGGSGSGGGNAAYADVSILGNFTHTCGTGLTLIGGTDATGGSASSFGTGPGAIISGNGSSNTYTLTVSNGNLTMIGGSGSSSRIQIASSTNLNVSVPNGSILMRAAPGSINGSPLTGANFGDVQFFAVAGATGTMAISTGGDLRMTGGAGVSGQALINLSTVGTTVPLTLTVGNNLLFTGGSNNSALTKLLTNSTISVSCSGDLVLQGGTNIATNASITSSLNNTATQGVQVTVGGNALLLGGGVPGNFGTVPGGITNPFALGDFAAIVGSAGTGINFTVGNSANKTGDLIMTAGQGSNATSAIKLNRGILNLNVSGNLVMTSGATGFSCSPYIGSNDQGSAAVGTINATLNVSAGQNLVMNGNGYNFCIIGAGGIVFDNGASAKTSQPTINVTAGGDIILNGASGTGTSAGQYSASMQLALLNPTSTALPGVTAVNANGGFALIGVAPLPFTNGANETISGNISVTAGGSVILNGGNSASAFARIGHGGMQKIGTNTDSYPTLQTLAVNAGRNIVLNTLAIATPGVAQIGNWSTASGNTITLIADNNYSTSPNFGPGYFTMTSGSQIQTAPNGGVNTNTLVKIYTAIQLFNTVNAPINGTTFTPSSVLGVNNQYEQWGVYAPGGVYLANQPFTFYYKRVGGLLVSSGADNGVLYNNGVLSFTKPEVTINSGNLGSNLDLNNVTINTTAVASAPLGSSANCLLITGPIGWSSSNSLTINCSQDLVVDNALTSSDTTGVSAVNLNVTRNVFIGDGAQSAASGVTTASAPVAITAGGSFNMYGGSIANTSATIFTNGAGGTTINASNGLTLQGGAGTDSSQLGVSHTILSAGTTSSALIGTITGNLVANVLGGDLNIRGGIGLNSTAAMYGGLNSTAALTVTVSTGNGYLVGGAGGNAIASGTGLGGSNAALDLNNLSAGTGTGNLAMNILQGNFNLLGGSGASQFIAVMGNGTVLANIPVGNLTIQGGTSSSSRSLISSAASFATTVQVGGNITLQAGSGGFDNFAMIGRRIANAGPISVTCGGTLSLTGQNNSWAAIGHGDADANISLQTASITVNAGADILLNGEIAGRLFNFPITSTGFLHLGDTTGFAQIGHLISNAGNYSLSGDIAVTAGDRVVLQAGSFNNLNTNANTTSPYASGAFIGHGANSATSGTVSISNATTINTRALSILAGSGATGGNALAFAGGSLPLTANVTAGDLFLQSGGSTGANAQLFSNAGICAVNVSNGNIILNAGLGAGTSSAPMSASIYAQLDDVDVTCAGSVTINGSLSDYHDAYMGPTSTGNFNLSVGADCIMTSGAGWYSFAELGCISPSATAINIAIGGHLLMTAQGNGYVNIGNGEVTSPAGVDVANINLAVGGNVVLTGSGISQSGASLAYGGLGFASIGHLNSQSANTAIAGDLNITCGGTVLLNPGLKTSAYARIGHGGVGKTTNSSSDTYGTGNILVLAAGNIIFNSSGNATISAFPTAMAQPAAYQNTAQVVNNCSGNITLVADTLHPIAGDVGTGHLIFSSANGYILTTQPGAQVRIYSSVRIFNFLQSSVAYINNQLYTASPLPPLPLPEILGTEAWGYAYANNSTNPYIGPNFTLYYKRIGGILLSNDTTSGATLSGSTYTFTSPEVVINTTTTNANDLLTALTAGSVTINAANLSGTSDANNCVLFRNGVQNGSSSTGLANLTWSNTNGLTLQAPTDIAVRSNIVSTSTSNSARGITLVAGRDVFVEAYGITGELQVANAPITVTAGRDFASLGPSVGFIAGGQVYSTGTGAGINPITITAARHMIIAGGPFAASATQVPLPLFATGGIATSDANVILTVQTGNLSILGGYGSPAGVYTNNTVTGLGAITITVAGDYLQRAGNGWISRAWLAGNGSNSTGLSSPISVIVGGNLSLLSGYGNPLNSANSASTSISSAAGGVVVTVGGAINVTSSPSISTNAGFAQIRSSHGPVTISSGGDVSLNAGPGSNSLALFANTDTGNISVSIGGNLTINSANIPRFRYLLSPGAGTAWIGGFGPVTNVNVLISKIGGNLTLNGNRNSLVAIGGSTRVASAQTYTGNITIENISGSVILNGYNGANNTGLGLAQIGLVNNTTSSPSILTGDVTIVAQGHIILNGGSTASAFARIGHSGQTKVSGTDTIQGNVSLFSANGDLTLNTATGGATIAAFGTGTLTSVIGGNTTLNGFANVVSQIGGITLLTGKTHTLNGSSAISNTSSTGISVVADNLYPTPAKFGLGRILTAASTSITSPGPVRLYSAAQQIDVVLGTINSQSFTPGPLNINSAMEQWFKYYPQFAGGFPFTFFYKTSLQGMILDAVAANSTLTQFLPLQVPSLRVAKEDAKKSEEQKKKV